MNEILSGYKCAIYIVVKGKKIFRGAIPLISMDTVFSISCSFTAPPIWGIFCSCRWGE
jgi:hypothetical protein